MKDSLPSPNLVFIIHFHFDGNFWKSYFESSFCILKEMLERVWLFVQERKFWILTGVPRKLNTGIYWELQVFEKTWLLFGRWEHNNKERLQGIFCRKKPWNLNFEFWRQNFIKGIQKSTELRETILLLHISTHYVHSLHEIFTEESWSKSS